MSFQNIETVNIDLTTINGESYPPAISDTNKKIPSMIEDITTLVSKLEQMEKLARDLDRRLSLLERARLKTLPTTLTNNEVKITKSISEDENWVASFNEFEIVESTESARDKK